MRVGHISPVLLEQLNRVAPLPDPGGCSPRRACQVRLRDGAVLPRVLFVERDSDLDFSLPPEMERNPYADILRAAMPGSAIAEEVIASLGAQWESPAAELRKAMEARSVDIDAVASIAGSPHQTPPAIYRKLRDAGETGMGYHLFELHLRDGGTVKCFSGGAFEFLDLPVGVSVDMIVDVTPLGRDATDFMSCDADTWTCFYRLPTSPVEADQYFAPRIN